MGKIKKILTNTRVIVLLIFLLLAVVAIFPNPWNTGAAIRAVSRESSAVEAGIQSPKATISPMSRERIVQMNNQLILDAQDYFDFTSELKVNRTIHVKTNKGTYTLITRPLLEFTAEQEEFDVTEEVFDEVLNETVNVTRKELRNKTLEVGTAPLGFSVYDAPTTNLRKGLDLQGGTRVLMQPETQLSQNDMEVLLDNLKERLNVYGLSDMTIREAGDLSGNQYILIEIAGANEAEVKDLLAKQGKFEAKIGNDTVFRGGQDITYVARTADRAGIDPTSGCQRASEGWVCRFRFGISLTAEAAQRQADISGRLTVEGDYLSKDIDLFLDDMLVDTLRIGSELKGRAITDIAISGSGMGATREEAIFNSLENMKRLQTILVTGSLPVKLNIVKIDSISPMLGSEFLNNAILIGLMAILVVSLIVFLRYRVISIVLPMMFTMVSEVILLLGFAALVGWNLDLAAIAGIIIAVGTGVDAAIVITDETLKGDKETSSHGWKDRIKKAFFIIMAAYFTTVAGMLPLWFAGAGLLKGFAFTTIIGVSFGTFITRPAFASISEIILKD